ncbi:MAG TPA: hypothetical protein VN841_06730 [Bryobacteraceae bacterium]|nr:hypothetical protein [Bryobacteraceae bacterium]
MAWKSRPYEVGLQERLKDFSHAVSYIQAAAEDSIEGFLLALRDLAEATKGMGKVAKAADKNRENLYRMLSEEGNPRLDSLWAVLAVMGLRLTVEPITAETIGAQPEAIELADPASAERAGNNQPPIGTVSLLVPSMYATIVGTTARHVLGNELAYTGIVSVVPGNNAPGNLNPMEEGNRSGCGNLNPWIFTGHQSRGMEI